MKNILWSLLGVLCLWGCSDFLEEESQDEVIVKTVTDFSEFLLGTAYPSTVYDVLYLLDDDVELNENLYYGDADNTYATSYFSCFTWQPDMWESETKPTDTYSGIYTQIMGVNAVLDGIDEAKGLDMERDYVKAEALALRGFYYWMLVNLYGESYSEDKGALGVPLKLTAGMVENGIARNTVEEVYEQIVEDLEVSLELFRKHPKRSQHFRINLTTANIILSRVYLYMERWADVITAADEAIESAGGLTDYTTFEGTFYMPTYTHSEVEWRYGGGQLRYGYVPSKELLALYGDDDKRKTFWFGVSMGVTRLKKKNPDYSENTSGGPTNVIRISEAYLNRAEAYAHMDNGLGNAQEDLNYLRRHRIEGYEDMHISEPQKLLEEIYLERRKELCFDEMRWFDLRRYGKPSISHRYKAKRNDPWMVFVLKEKDPLYVLPISNVVLENNILLEQNESAFVPARSGNVE